MSHPFTLNSEKRCPHCRISDPMLFQVYCSEKPLPRSDGYHPNHWAVFCCVSCGSLVTAKLLGISSASDFRNPIEVFPSLPTAHEDVPDVARTFLQQAMDTLHAPDAAAVMAGSAVDAMLKGLGLIDGSLYSRIDEALANGLITKGMSDWAHSVRLGSNRPRHADKESPHVSVDEAKISVDFAKALGDFLFVLTAQVDRGIKKVEEIS
jgi:Domain of unknown function (DUF4145)